MSEHHRPAHAREAEQIPHEEFLDGEQLRIVITGIDDKDLRAAAAEAANKQFNAELSDNGGSRLKGFVKKMWKTTWRDYYLNKYQRQHFENAVETNDIESHLDNDIKDSSLELENTKRWAQAFDENLRQDLLSEEEAETFGLVLDRNPDGSTNPEGAALKNELTELMEDYVEGRITGRDAFNENVKRIMHEAAQSGTHNNMIGRAQLYATNLFYIGENMMAMKMRAESQGRTFSVRDTMDNAVIIMGSTEVGPETEAHKNRVERTVEKLNKIPVVNLINETSLATAVSVAYSIGGWATKTTAGAAAAVVAAGGAAGVWAGFREARALKDEKAQHSREFARGEFNESEVTGKRREALDETRYESKSATELMEQLNLLYNDEGEFRVNDGDSFREAMQIIAEIEARNRLSSQRDIDLIHFSKGQMSRERRLLRLQLAKAKIDMRHLLEEADHNLLTEFGVNPDDIDTVKAHPDGDVLDFVLEPIRDGNEGVLDTNVVGEINEDINAKDRLYRRLRNKQVTGAVLKGTILGVTIGTFVQEAVVAPLRSDTQGLVERFVADGNPEVTKQSLLDSLINPDAPIEMSPSYTTIELPGTGNKLTLPDNLQVEKTGENTLSINGKDISISDLKVNADGSLTAESQDLLRQAGFSVNHEQTFGEPIVTEKEVKSTPADILKNHKEDTVRVTRDFHYDNDTEMYWKDGKHLGADKNELGLWQPRYQKDGDITIPINMSLGGSSHEGMSAHWQELAREGKLQIALSLSKGTQHQVFMVPIGENGRAIIKADSPVANFFRPGEDPKDAQFMGKFTEVVEIRGVDESGKTHIAPLATDVGPGLKRIPDVVTETKPNPITTYSLEYQPNKDLDVSVPPVLPWYPRKGLEVISSAPPVTIVPSAEYISSYYEGGPSNPDTLRKRMSPRLQNGDNPDTELNEREEAKWYWNTQTTEHRYRATDLAYQIPPLSNAVEAIVAIPVAGHQEQDNIYRTLSAYLNQSLARNKYEIVLYVNHPETDKNGNPTSAQATLDEISRFQADHPELPVRVIYEKLPREEARIGNIRKLLNDALVKRLLDRGSTDKDLIIISNDADTVSMSDNYLENFTTKFQDNPNIDSMLGQLDWDNESFLHYPELHIGTRLFLYTSIQYRQIGGGLGSSGANFAFRAKSYSAVGGYNPEAALGEDVALGHAFNAARQGASTKKAVGFAGNTASRLETSGRRSVYVLENFNDAPINQWDYSFGADDDAVRAGGLSRPRPDFTKAADRRMIIENIENIVTRSLKVYGYNFKTDANGRKHHANRFLERSLVFCGIDFEWTDDNKLRIINADRMFEGLIKFEQKHSARS